MKRQILYIYKNNDTDIGARAHNLASSQRFYIYVSMFPLCS